MTFDLYSPNTRSIDPEVDELSVTILGSGILGPYAIDDPDEPIADPTRIYGIIVQKKLFRDCILSIIRSHVGYWRSLGD